MAVFPDLLPSPDTSETLPGKVTLTVIWTSAYLRPKACIVKVKEPLSWVMLAPIELLNSLRGIPLTVVTQRFSPSPSTVISVLPSSNPSPTSSELQDDSEPKPSPRLTWVISMVLFSWISNS